MSAITARQLSEMYRLSACDWHTPLSVSCTRSSLPPLPRPFLCRETLGASGKGLFFVPLFPPPHTVADFSASCPDRGQLQRLPNHSNRCEGVYAEDSFRGTYSLRAVQDW